MPKAVANVDAGPCGAIHAQDLVQRFYETVPLSLYDAYQPFVSRFFDKSPCPSSAVRDLLSPGFPDFIARTSGTSESTFKLFPWYPENFHRPSEGVRFCAISTFRFCGPTVKIVDEQGELQKEAFVTIAGSGIMRRRMGVAVKDDDKAITETPPLSSVPFAVWYIPNFLGNLLMTMFFAVTDPSLVSMRATYISAFYDAVLTLEEHWDIVIDSVEKGTIPDVYDLDYCRPFLEAQIKPNPHRAAELRSIQKGTEGWLKRIWPSLKTIRAISSGSYAAFVPKIRHHIGPNVEIESTFYASTECVIGHGYDPTNDHNLYRVSRDSHFEYLDVTEPQALHQAWELQTGKRYEIVATTRNGLWRYQMRDVVEIGGFDPSDGQPVIRFIGRRGVGFRIFEEMMSEELIKNAIHSTHHTLGRVLEFVAELDDRQFPRSYGYFVELEGELGPDPDSAPRKVQEVLFTNPGYKSSTDIGRIGMPTIRIVAPRTFRAYREWRLELTGHPMGQIKVPTTIVDVATREWLAKRVISEVGLPSVSSV